MSSRPARNTIPICDQKEFGDENVHFMHLLALCLGLKPFHAFEYRIIPGTDAL